VSAYYTILPIATDGVAWSVGLSISLCVCIYVPTFVSHAKTAKSIEIPLGELIQWAQRTMIRWGREPQIPQEKGSILGLVRHVKKREARIRGHILTIYTSYECFCARKSLLWVALILFPNLHFVGVNKHFQG